MTSTAKGKEDPFFGWALILVVVGQLIYAFDGPVFLANSLIFVGLISFLIFTVRWFGRAIGKWTAKPSSSIEPAVVLPAVVPKDDLALPAAVERVAAADSYFETTAVPALPDTPPLKGGPLNAITDEKTMRDHLALLSEFHDDLSRVRNHAQSRYSRDRATLSEQQAEITQLCRIAQHHLRKLDSRIPPVEAAPTIPQIFIPPTAIIPPAKTPAAFDKAVDRIFSVKPNHRLGTKGMLLQYAVQIGMAYVELQKFQREFAEGCAAMPTYREKVVQQLEELGREHRKVVPVSAVLHGYSIELRDLLPQAQALSNADRPLSGPEIVAMHRLQMLALISARSRAGRNV